MTRRDVLAYTLGVVGVLQMLAAGWWGAWIEFPTMLGVQGGECLVAALAVWAADA